MSKMQDMYLNRVKKIIGYTPVLSDTLLSFLQPHSLCKKLDISLKDFVDAAFWAFPPEISRNLFHTQYPLPSVYSGVRSVARALDFIRKGRWEEKERLEKIILLRESAFQKLKEFQGRALHNLVISNQISEIEAAHLLLYIDWKKVSKKKRKDVVLWAKKMEDLILFGKSRKS